MGFSTVIYEEYGLTIEEIMERAERYGYEGIEYNFFEWPSQVNWRRIVELIETHRVKVASIGTRHMYLRHKAYLASPFREVREKGLEYVTECFKLADKVEAEIVQAGWAFQGAKLEASYEETWRNAIESLRKIAGIAEEYDKVFVIEYANRYEAQLVNNMNQALKMIEEVASDRVAIMADTFHMNIEDSSFREAIIKANGRLKYMHVADSNRLAPGWGHIDFEEILRALKEIGYEGYLIMEFIPKPDPDTALKQASTYFKKLFNEQ